jgi:glutathione peroxidase
MRWFLLVLMMSCGFFQSDARSEIPTEKVQSQPWAEDLELVSLDGQPFDTVQLEGKVVLFVNVASKCGYTSQYDGLQALWARLKDRGLVVVGVPSNQFGGQEPGGPEEIASFCRMNYGVDFPLLEKQDVRGDDKSRLYDYLVSSPLADGSEVSWNFEKFLVGADGAVLGRYRSRTAPEDSALADDIEAALQTLSVGSSGAPG